MFKNIANYFDNFIIKNDIEMPMYSYLYFYVEYIMNKRKKLFMLLNKNKDIILIYYYYNKKYYFPYLPLYQNKIDSYYIKELNNYFMKFIKNKSGNKITFVPNSVKNLLKDFKLRKNDVSYIYKSSDFLDLSGKKFKKLRYSINKFLNETNGKDIIIKDYENKYYNDVLELLEYWNRKSKEKQFRLYDVVANRNYLDVITKNNLKLKCYTQLIFIDGELCGINSFNERYPNSPFLDAFITKTKFDKYKYLTDFLEYKSFLIANEKNYEIINWAGDLGLKTLREHKLKFRPFQIIQNYSMVI